MNWIASGATLGSGSPAADGAAVVARRRGGGGGVGSLSFSVQANAKRCRRRSNPASGLREPLLPKEEFEIMKRERLAGIEQMKTEPAMLAPRNCSAN